MVITKSDPYSKEEREKLNWENNKFILESLASDLKRVAIGLHRGSNTMAERFLEEALKRKEEIDTNSVAPYINSIVKKISRKTNSDEALMYSTLIQNYTQKRKF